MATQNIFDLTDTWNNVATTFTAINMNVTDTASAAGSRLIGLQVGGADIFTVTKSGAIAAASLALTGNVELAATSLLRWGTTASFPALGRSGTTLRVLLADGSTYAPLEASAISGTASVAARTTTPIPAGGTVGSGFVFSSTANFGIFFGSGAPTLSAAKGSLYLRSDGSGVADRMYVNTNGATTWTAVATAS